MDISAFIANFVVLTGFGLLLAGLVYSRSAHRKSSANMILAILLVTESLRIMTIFVDYNRPLGDISAASPFVFSRLLNGPLIYLYASLVLGLRHRLQRRDLRHFVPFLVMLIVVYLSPVLLGDHAGKGEWRSNVNFNVTVANIYPLLVLAFMMIVLISYSVATLKLISLNRHRLVNLYADYESISLKWLRALCYVHLIIAIMAPLYFLMVSQISAYIGAPMAFFSYSFITTAFLFFFITVYGFQQPVVFQLSSSEVLERGNASAALEDQLKKEPSVENNLIDSPALGEEVESGDQKQERYQLSSMSEEEAKNFYKLLINECENQQLYLQAGLKISDLANVMGLSVQDISQIINQCSGNNFYEFINHYRIDYAKKVAKQSLSSEQKLTPAEMAARSGFKSSSTFYKHFKAYTGITPKQYLLQLKAS